MLNELYHLSEVLGGGNLTACLLKISNLCQTLRARNHATGS